MRRAWKKKGVPLPRASLFSRVDVGMDDTSAPWWHELQAVLCARRAWLGRGRRADRRGGRALATYWLADWRLQALPAKRHAWYVRVSEWAASVGGRPASPHRRARPWLADEPFAFSQYRRPLKAY